jgi:hypothetical protein
VGGCLGGGRIGPLRELTGGGGKLANMLDVGVVGVPGGDNDMTDDAGEGGIDVGGVAGTTSG